MRDCNELALAIRQHRRLGHVVVTLRVLCVCVRICEAASSAKCDGGEDGVLFVDLFDTITSI